jgi:pimeloyl-ACP methyl ester carboxylesterase
VYDGSVLGATNRHVTTPDGLRIAYERAGAGTALVLLHGFIVDRRMWRPQIEDLSHDFDVIAWDAPGCGDSDDPPEEFTMAQFAECLALVLDDAGVGTAHLLGLSWGGTLALEFYRMYAHRVRSLVLAGTYAGWTGSLGEGAAAQRLAQCLRDSELPAEAWVRDWAPAAFSEGVSDALIDEFATLMQDFHPVGFRAMSRAVTPDFSDVLDGVRVPTLLLWGDDDKRSPLQCGEMMRGRIPGARLVVIPNAGHVSNFEQPGRFNAEVRAFVAGVDGY